MDKMVASPALVELGYESAALDKLRDPDTGLGALEDSALDMEGEEFRDVSPAVNVDTCVGAMVSVSDRVAVKDVLSPSVVCGGEFDVEDGVTSVGGMMVVVMNVGLEEGLGTSSKHVSSSLNFTNLPPSWRVPPSLD